MAPSARTSAPARRALAGERGSSAGRRRPPDRVVYRRRRRGLLLGGLVLVAAAVAVIVHPGGSPSRSGLGRHVDVDGTSVEAIDPALFHSGSCVAYAPTSGNRHLTVFLDAGHGGVDPGALGTTTSGATIEEATETLPVEMDALGLLRRAGFRVVVSRTGPTSVVRLTAADLSGGVLSLQGAHDDVAARDICANMAHANLLVGIYFDAGGAGAAGSITTYDAVRSFSAQSLRYARLLQADVLADMNAHGWQIPNGGVPTDYGLGSSVPTSSTSALAIGAADYHHIMLLGPAEPGYFTTPSEMPGALIEPLFITDPFEGSIAASALGRQAIADGIATSVEQYFAR